MMDVSIDRRWEGMIDAVVREGRFPSANAVVDEGLRLVEEGERKLKDLRATIEASIAAGGAYTDEEVGRFLEQAREKRRAKRDAAA